MTDHPPYNDLETVAEGDTVVVVGRHVSGKTRHQYATVQRATRGAIWIGGHRYTRTGRRWRQPDRPAILPVTPTTRTWVEIGDQEAEFQQLRWTLFCQVRRIEGRQSVENLARLRAAIEALG